MRVERISHLSTLTSNYQHFDFQLFTHQQQDYGDYMLADGLDCDHSNVLISIKLNRCKEYGMHTDSYRHCTPHIAGRY